MCSRRILSLTEKHFGARCHPADTVTAGALPFTAFIAQFPRRSTRLAARHSCAMTRVLAALADSVAFPRSQASESLSPLSPTTISTTGRAYSSRFELGCAAGSARRPERDTRLVRAREPSARFGGSGRPFLRADALGEQVQRSRLPPLPWPRFPCLLTQPLAASGEPLCAPARARAVACGRLPAHGVTRACDDLGSAAHALFAIRLTLWLAGRWVEGQWVVSGCPGVVWELA